MILAAFQAFVLNKSTRETETGDLILPAVHGLGLG